MLLASLYDNLLQNLIEYNHPKCLPHFVRIFFRTCLSIPFYTHIQSSTKAMVKDLIYEAKYQSSARPRGR